MLANRKSQLGSFGFGVTALLVATVVLVVFKGPMVGSGGASSGAAGSFFQAVTFRAQNAISNATSSLPNDFQTFPQRAEEFFTRNATTARLQLEGMKNSVSGNLSWNAWFGRGSQNLLQHGADVAAQAAGNKPHVLARKVPVVNGALDAASQRINSVSQSLSNTARGF